MYYAPIVMYLYDYIIKGLFITFLLLKFYSLIVASSFYVINKQISMKEP